MERGTPDHTESEYDCFIGRLYALSVWKEGRQTTQNSKRHIPGTKVSRDDKSKTFGLQLVQIKPSRLGLNRVLKEL